MNERVARAQTALHERGLTMALLSSPHNVCYLTGAEVSIETGPNLFAGGPTLAFLSPSGHVTLIVPSQDASAAMAQADADSVESYPGYSYLSPVDLAASLWAALKKVLQDAGVTSGTLGVESTSFPVSIEQAMQREFDKIRLEDATQALVAARMVKTSDEIARLRSAIDLTAVGQNTARQMIEAGISELALFSKVRGAMEEAAGCRLPMVGDLVSGAERTFNVGGWPNTRKIQEGDLVLVDLAPRLAGYWGDSCNTLYLGEPGPEQRRMFQTSVEALAKGIEFARPGIRAADLDSVMRTHVEKAGYSYPHHSGHALGTTVHEAPRLVPYEQIPLQAGMVLAMEPGAYVSGIGGVRSEHIILITDHGAEVLSSFAHGF